MSDAVDKDEALGRPAGGGKMPTSRGRKDNAKPYDRNSSMFSRFCSNVKDYLVPSYFTYNQSRLNAQPDGDLGKTRGSNVKLDNALGEITGLNEKDDGMSTTRGMNEKPASAASCSTGEQSTIPFRLDGPTTSNNAIKPRQSLQSFQQDLNGNVRSDSSTSAGVTNMFLPRPAIVPPTSDNYLWSLQQNNDTSKQAVPSFDVSAFSQSVDQTYSDVSKISPAKLSTSLRVNRESLFYAGQTTYGGAATILRVARSDSSSSPYQRREAKTQQVIAKPSGALGNTGVTGSTSRRILEAMQRGEESLASLRNLHSRDSVVDVTSQANTSSMSSVFHRNSAQFDATVSKDSVLANIVRAAPSAPELSRISASPPGVALPSKDTYFNNPEFGRATNASEMIRERPQESGRKMKSAPKVRTHYTRQGDDDEDVTEPNPLCNIKPLPAININPGLFAATTSAASSFTFSMPRDVVDNVSPKPSIEKKVTKSTSALDNDVQFRVPSEIGICNTFKINGAKSSSAVSRSSSNASETASLPLLGSKSVGNQFSSSSVTPRTISETGFFSAAETTGGLNISSSSHLSNSTNSGTNRLMPNFSAAETNGPSNVTTGLFGPTFAPKPTSEERKINSHHESKEGLPSIIEDNGLSRPPLRDGANAVVTHVTSSSIVASSNVDVVINKPVLSAEQSMTVTTIPSIDTSTQDTNVNSHCANVAPLSELFKKPSNVWTCDECYVTNKSDSTVCVSCETQRPGHAPLSSLNSVVQDAARLPLNSVSGSDKPTGTGTMFSFGSLPKESAASEGVQSAPGFRPSNAGLFTSLSIPSSSGFGGATVVDENVAKPSPFNSGSVFGAPASNAPVVASLFPNTTGATPSSSVFGSNISNDPSASGTSSNGTFSDSNARNVSFDVPPKIEVTLAAVISSGSTATTSTGGFNFGGFGGFSNNPIPASVGNSQSSTSSLAPMFGFPTTATTTNSSSSLFPASSSAAVLLGSTSTTNSSKFNYTPPTASIFGIPSSSSSSASTIVVPTFGLAATPQFGAAATTTTVSASMFPAAAPSTSVPFFGMGAPAASSTPMFGIPATTVTSNMFGTTQAAPEKPPGFVPMFGQQSNAPMFGQPQVQQPSATSSALFRFGAPTATTNSSSGFQMSPAVATPFFGMQPAGASTPSGFGASVFPTPAFGTTKSDSFPSAPGFGAPIPNAPFGTSNGMGSSVPNFGAAAKPAFGASTNGNAQTGVIPTFGTVAPTNGPSFPFGNGTQNSQAAPSLFTFGGGNSSNQSNDSSKMTGAGQTYKRGLDDGSSNGANPAKRSSDMFGNQIQNSNMFAFGSGQQQAAPANMWNQQQPPSGVTNNNPTAFTTTLPAAGFNFAAAASQFNFPAAPTNNPGGVFQFGNVANQQAAPNPFGGASNVAQNPFNNNANAPNPFDVAPSNASRVIKKAVRKTVKR